MYLYSGISSVGGFGLLHRLVYYSYTHFQSWDGFHELKQHKVWLKFHASSSTWLTGVNPTELILHNALLVPHVMFLLLLFSYPSASIVTILICIPVSRTILCSVVVSLLKIMSEFKCNSCRTNGAPESVVNIFRIELTNIFCMKNYTHNVNSCKGCSVFL